MPCFQLLLSQVCNVRASVHAHWPKSSLHRVVCPAQCSEAEPVHAGVQSPEQLPLPGDQRLYTRPPSHSPRH